MTIREVERRCGMERANIRFYEREGLLTPQRAENGYRTYTEEDVQLLLRIRLLRSLHIGLDEIGALVRGERALEETLSEQLDALAREQREILCAQNVCLQMREAHADFKTLDAEKYLAQLDERPQPQFTYPRAWDKAAPLRCPVRRYLAYEIDGVIFSFAAWGIYALCGGMLLQAEQVLLLLLAFAMRLIFEPLQLHLFGTTAGNALLGLYIETEDGTKPTFSEGWSRLWARLWYGMGMGIPIFSLYRMYKSYAHSNDGEQQPWDDGFVLTLRARNWKQHTAAAATYVMCLFLMLVMILAQRMPPNRGALTAEAYAENFNYYAKYFGYDFGKTMQPDGTWREIETDNGVYTFYLTDNNTPDFQIETSNGAVRRVLFTVEAEDNAAWLGSYYPQRLAATAALMGAQRQAGLFDTWLTRLQKALPAEAESSTYADCGVEATCTVESNGYWLWESVTIPREETPIDEREFRIIFSVEIVP